MAMLVITRGYIWDLLWVTGASGWWLRTAAWSMGWWSRPLQRQGRTWSLMWVIPLCLWHFDQLRYVGMVLQKLVVLDEPQLPVTCLPATIPAIPSQVFEVDEVEAHCDEALGLVGGPMIVLSEICFHFRDIPITILHLSRFIQVSKGF